MKMSLCLMMLLTLPAFAANDIERPDPNRWSAEIAAFDEWDSKNAHPQNAILFVGSSTIRLWKTADSFPGLPVINRGFGGSWMADSAYFADRLILRYKPAVVVLYAGDNDIAGGLAPKAVYDAFAKLTEIIRSALPQAHIVCLSIKPSQSRWAFWPQMQEANRLLAECAGKDPRITFVDLTAELLDKNGLPDPALYEPDVLHLNKAGYAKCSALLAPILSDKYINR